MTSNAVTYKRHPVHTSYFFADNGTYFQTHFGKLKILLPKTINTGYRLVPIRINKIKKNISAHRLILECFMGHSELVVNHKNGKRDDNRLENLEYVTSSENSFHRWGNKKRFVTELASNRFYVQISLKDGSRFRKQVRGTKEEAYEVARELYKTHFGVYPW